MKYSHKVFFYISFSLTLISGVGLWIISDFFKQQTPYGIMAHPWQAYWLDFHLISLPFTMLSLGGLSISHIIPQWKRCHEFWQRYSGIFLTVLLGLSALSGYGIQVHVLDGLYFDKIHEISSLAIIPILIIHIWACRLQKKK